MEPLFYNREALGQLAEMNHLTAEPFTAYLETSYPCLKGSKAAGFFQGFIMAMNGKPNLLPLEPVGIIRGGDMRGHMLGTGELDNSIVALAGKLTPDMIGSNPESIAAFRHAFSSVRDIDVVIFDQIDMGSLVKGSIPAAIRMLQPAYEPFAEDNVPATLGKYLHFRDQKFDYHIDLHHYGRSGSIAIADLTLTPTGDGTDPACILSISQQPQTPAQLDESLRNGLITADIDNYAVGNLIRYGNQLLVIYPSVADLAPNFAINQLTGAFLDSTIDADAYALSFTQATAAAFRETGFRSLFASVGTMPGNPFGGLSLTDVTKLRFKQFGPARPAIPLLSREEINALILNDMDNLHDRHVPIASDKLYGAASSPLFWLAYSRAHGHLQFTPLGRMLENDDDFQAMLRTMKTILCEKSPDMFGRLAGNTGIFDIPLMQLSLWSQIAAIKNSRCFGPLLIVEAMKTLGKIPSETPATVEAFINLMDSARLVS